LCAAECATLEKGAAAPALGLRLGANDSGNDPAKQTTRKAYDLLANGL
jgi:RND superfamily putative drug exporter